MTKTEDELKSLGRRVREGCDAVSDKMNGVKPGRRKLYVALMFLVGVLLLLLNIFIPRLARSGGSTDEPARAAQSSAPAAADTAVVPASVPEEDFRFGSPGVKAE